MTLELTPATPPYRCLYCLREFEANGPRTATREHVFPESLGGRATVPACSDCNNRIFGAGVEGPLQSKTSLLQLLRAIDGETGRWLRGTVPGTDQRVDVDLAAGEHRISPVVEDDGMTVKVAGDPERVREIAIAKGAQPEQVDAAIAKARASQPPLEEVTVTLSEDVLVHAQLAGKVALGALVAVDPARIDSPLADELRDVLRDPRAALEEGRVMPGVDAGADLVLARLKEVAEHQGRSLPGEVEAANRVVFIPYTTQVTVIAVRVHGVALLNPVLDAPCPPLSHSPELPVVVTERQGRITATDLSDAVLPRDW